MLPQTYPSEMRTFPDPLTGRKIIQLTNSPDHDSVHLYFTENAFTKGGKEVFFTSDRGTPGMDNVFTVNIETGLIKRVTGYTDTGISQLTKDPKSTTLLYGHGRDAVLHSLVTGEKQVIYAFPEGFRPGRLSLNCDHTLAGVLMNEDVHVEHGVNYAGFEEKMYLVKRSRIVFVPLQNGKPGAPYFGVRDTCEAGHLQFSPTDRNLCMYCHEGPWHLVMQRIFLVDTDTLEVFPCFRQNKDDSVGHEFWTRDGRVFFDNRGPGHDGTITSSRTQAVAKEPVDSAFIPYVGLADKRGALISKTLLPHYCNHYHCGDDPGCLVGDEIDDLVRIELTKYGPVITKLCRHGTSWRGQKTHCHPTVSWEDNWVLYASDATGKVQLYLTAWEPHTKED